MEALIRSATSGPALRFLLLGGANTAVTSAAFLALSYAMDPAVAFAIAYLAGLAFVTFATPRFVFGTRPPARRRGALAAWYAGVFVVGLGVTWLLDRGLGLDRWMIVLGTLCVTAPLGFVGARLLAGRAVEERG